VYATYARISIYQSQLGCREEKLASPFRVLHAFETLAGIDLGSAQPIVLSDGTVFGIPRAAPTERRKLENAHRTVHRRKKGSKNREKAKLRLARLQAKAARRSCRASAVWHRHRASPKWR